MNATEMKRLNRRDLLAALLGTSTLALGGCSRVSLPPAGMLLSPDVLIGHKIRDKNAFSSRAKSRLQKQVVIVGGGIAGLSAAWRLLSLGIDDFVVLEMESVFGGTSRGGEMGDFRFPWGAHYLPTPMKENETLIELLKEMGVVVGVTPAGDPVIAEEFLCRDPQERVFVEGEWIEGLYPAKGASVDDLQQLKEFQGEIDKWISARDRLGRRMFAIPIAAGSDEEEVRLLDSISMATWMDQFGWTSSRLRWLVDYSCRDDYGLTIDQTSAWAGVFYFASRNEKANASSQDVITWPEGNARIVDYLSNTMRDRVEHSHPVIAIEHDPKADDSVRVLAWDKANGTTFEFEAERVIYAVPQFVAPYLIRDFSNESRANLSEFRYGAWLVANIELSDRPRENGFPMCWDNVLYLSNSLGYVVSTHQMGIDDGPTVLTWYMPLLHDDAKVSREQLMSMTWSDWADVVMTDLTLAHPDLPLLVTRMDIMRWGHAMIQPRVGFVFNEARENAAKPLGRIHFAGTDLSGVALMEEAFYHGVRAADECARL